MKTKKVETDYGPMTVICGDHISEIIAEYGSYEKEYINICLGNTYKKRGIAIDVGANIGVWSMALSSNFKRILSYEPNKILFPILKDNVGKNVTAFNYAVGHFGGTTCIDSSKNEENYGSIPISNSGDEIQMVTLDELAYSGEDVSFIKIDVEGAEKLVIWGGKKTIMKYKPVLFFEHTRINEFMDKMFIYEKEIREWNIFEFLLCECGYDRIIKFKSNYLAL